MSSRLFLLCAQGPLPLSDACYSCRFNPRQEGNEGGMVPLRWILIAAEGIQWACRCAPSLFHCAEDARQRRGLRLLEVGVPAYWLARNTLPGLRCLKERHSYSQQLVRMAACLPAPVIRANVSPHMGVHGGTCVAGGPHTCGGFAQTVADWSRTFKAGRWSN